MARCTAEDPSARYQSVEEIVKTISNQQKPYRIVIAVALTITLIVSGMILWNRHDKAAPVIEQKPQEPSTVLLPDTPQTQTSYEPENHKDRSRGIPESSLQPSTAVTMGVTEQTELMEKELERRLDSAYRSTIVTFRDSVFPSLTVGRQWEKETSEFHSQALEVAADLSRKYPDIPESVVIERVESRFQNLVSYVFNQMRENGQQQKSPE